jgi:hypothetical protein
LPITCPNSKFFQKGNNSLIVGERLIDDAFRKETTAKFVQKGSNIRASAYHTGLHNQYKVHTSSGMMLSHIRVICITQLFQITTY